MNGMKAFVLYNLAIHCTSVLIKKCLHVYMNIYQLEYGVMVLNSLM